MTQTSTELPLGSTGTKNSPMGRSGNGRSAVPVADPREDQADGVFSIDRVREREEEVVLRQAEIIEAEVAAAADPYAGMTKRQRKAAEKARKHLRGTFADYPHLLALKPKERYLFRSDYYEVDDGVACVLGFFHDEAAHDDFGAFWGINRIPTGLPEGVTSVVLESVRRMSEKWVSDKLKTGEHLTNLNEKEAGTAAGASTKRKSQKRNIDMDLIAGEIQDGASYLHVHDRLLLKAPNLAMLEEAIDKVGRLYVDRFGTLSVAAYAGEQRQELSGLLRRIDRRRGPGFHYTSVELAGSHSLVTNGLNDATGVYVGNMVGDVNNSAVLLDPNKYERHVVIADPTINTQLGRTHMSNLWGSKLSQAALVDNRKVVHLVLDGLDLDRLGPRLDSITARLNMNVGDINMLEMFGDESDELSVFPAHLDKVVLMAEQAYETTDSDRSIIRGSLKQTLTQFYIDKNMWYRNAKENKDRLRVVGLPHKEVPRLQDLVTYFASKYKALVNSAARDDEMLHAYNVLGMLFKDLLDSHGDLFNTHTNDDIDGVGEARRVIYDFSRLMRRGRGVAMAQLVNVIGFAVSALDLGDSVIIHGTELIDDRVKEYITTQLQHLTRRGGRVVYLYNDIDKMLADEKFNRFPAADYTLLGTMLEATVAEYQRKMHQDIPPDLEKLVTERNASYVYLRRDYANVVFEPNLFLGVHPDRQARQEQLREIMPSVPYLHGRLLVPEQPEADQDVADVEPEPEAPVMRPQRTLQQKPRPSTPTAPTAPERALPRRRLQRNP